MSCNSTIIAGVIGVLHTPISCVHSHSYPAASGALSESNTTELLTADCVIDSQVRLAFSRAHSTNMTCLSVYQML